MSKVWLLAMFIYIQLTALTVADGRLDSRELAELLKIATASFSTNAHKITTWTGDVSGKVSERVGTLKLEDGRTIAGPITREAEFEQRFKIDTTRGSFYSECDILVRKFVGKDQSVTINKKPMVFQCISTPEHFIRFELTAVTGPISGFELPSAVQNGRTIERMEARDAELAAHSYMFDPRAYFLTRDTRPLHTYFESLIKASSTDHFPVTATVEGGKGSRKLKLEISYNGPEELTVTEFYDESFGFCCVRQDRIGKSSGVVLESTEMSYEVRDGGIIVPTRMLHRKSDKSGPYFTRSLDYKNHEINLTLPRSQFELTAMDLEMGDRYVDRIESKVFVVNAEGELVPPREYPGGPSGDSRSSVKVILFSTAVLLLSFWIYRKYRSPR